MNLKSHMHFTGDINYFGPSLTSVRLLQEKEKELRESEKYWSRRIQNLEDHHSKLSRIMEQEYDKSLKEISCQVPRVSMKNFRLKMVHAF